MTKKYFKAVNINEKGVLSCRGYVFELGKVHDTGYPEDELSLCSETVFHFCEDIHDVFRYYDAFYNGGNFVICEVEALGAVISDSDKMKSGSNKIRINKIYSRSELTEMLIDISKGINKIPYGDGVYYLIRLCESDDEVIELMSVVKTNIDNQSEYDSFFFWYQLTYIYNQLSSEESKKQLTELLIQTNNLDIVATSLPFYLTLV